MSDYTFFTVEQYENVSVLKWTNAAATRVLRNGELRVELQAFVLTAQPTCVVVSFTQLEQCSSSLIGSLVGLDRQLNERGRRLKLCEMNPLLREQFARLQLNRLFAIHDTLSDAIAACEEEAVCRGQHGQEETKD